MTDHETFPPKFWASTQGLIDLQKVGAVEFREDQILDRLMIEDVFKRFGIAHDENRVDVILSLMTDDISFEFSTGSATPEVVIKGLQAVRDRLEPGVPLMYGQRRHCISNIVIERLTDSEATAIAYGMVPRAADGFVIQASVIYLGELRKESDGFWRLSRFFIGVDDYASDTPDETNQSAVRAQ